MGNAALLSIDKSISPKNERRLQDILIAWERAKDLTSQIQNLTKNKISIKTSLDIYWIIKETFDFLTKTTNKIIEKKIDIRPSEFFVNWNESELSQVFMNLGINSCKAIEERGFRQNDYIKISAENFTNNNDNPLIPNWEYIHIKFEDNWRWMSKEVLEKAFDPLFSTRDKWESKGQWLGLFSVHNIISSHNGHINIESTEWVWTTIHIYLPKTVSIEQTKPKEEKNIIGGNETVLIIEDEKQLQDVLKLMLEFNGYKVLIANDWIDWIDLYKEEIDSIDLVILDLTMPRMSWEMTLEKLIDIKSDIKVIISSWQSSEIWKNNVLSKAKWFIGKPYKMEQLNNTIREVLDEDK